MEHYLSEHIFPSTETNIHFLATVNLSLHFDSLKRLHYVAKELTFITSDFKLGKVWIL